MTNIVKVRFINGGEPTGREYSYYDGVDLAIGDMVELDVKGAKAKGIVTQLNVDEKEIEPFKSAVKTISQKWVEEVKEDGSKN